MNRVVAPSSISAADGRTPAPEDHRPGDTETALERRLDAVHERAVERVRQGVEDIRSNLVEPLQTTLRRVAEAHRRLAERAALEEGAAGDRGLWERVVAYREETGTEVLEAVRAHLAGREPGESIGQTWLDAFQALAHGGADVETEIRLPEDAALFRAGQDDSLMRRVRKWDVRTRRSLQATPRRLANGFRKVVGREPRPFPVRERVVPVRPLVDYHLQVRLPRILQSAHDAQQQAVAQHVSRLEDALTDWNQAVLDAEEQLDRADFHQPESLPRAPSKDEDEEPSEPAPRPDLAAMARALQAVLDAAAEATIDLAVDEPQLAAASPILAADVARAGTFLLDLGDRRLPEAAKSSAARIRERQQGWSAWHQQVLNRLELNLQLIAFRQDLREVEEALLDRVTAATLEPVFASFRGVKDTLRTAQAEMERACEAAERGQSTRELVKTLRGAQSRTLRQLQGAWRNMPGLVSSDQVLSEPGLEEWGRIGELIAQLPDALSVHTAQPEDEPNVEPGRRTVQLDLREAAADALALPLPDQLAEHAAPLKKRVIDVWGATEQVQDIVRFNLGAALDELAAAEGTVPAGDAEPPAQDDDEQAAAAVSPVHAARQLISDGLRRAADTLTELEQSLWDPWQGLADAAFEALSEDWSALRRRATADAVMEERWLGFQTRFTRRAERGWQSTKEGWEQFRQRAGRVVALGTRGVKRLIRRGQEAVGVSETADDESPETMDAIASVKKLQASLPLVYRRLFALDPLTEPSLFEGRSRDLVRVRHHFGRWQRGQHAGVVILQAPLGSGRTSLLNVLAETAFEKGVVHRLDLEERLRLPAEFAKRVATSLNLEVPDDVTLETLESQLLEMRRPDPPTVCLIDNLEHLLLQAPGGTDLIERVLIFLSRTDATVYWVATVGDLTWQFVEKTAPAAAGLVTEFALPALDRAALEGLIGNRHGRTGMSLRFEASARPSPLLRQRLRRARTAERRHALLREAFFDALYRVSGGNIMLALFYWMRSADFSAGDDVLTIESLEPLSFRFLGSFDLARSFTLKAFLVHNTLTPEEHARVVRMPEDESAFLLESLLNQRILEPTDSGAARTSTGHFRIVPGQRYQIRPLMVHPVTEHLRGRHIVY